MNSSANIQLRLLNKREGVSLVREMLRGLGDALALEQHTLDDMTTAVSEACNNVVLHAYDGAEGPLEVAVQVQAEALIVVVRDEGGGIRPRPISEHAMQGVGLAVIQALTHRVEFSGELGGGTVVLMEFRLDGGSETQATFEPLSEAGQAVPGELDGNCSYLRVAPFALAGRILSRLVGTYAARARFSLDRLSDAQMLADALAAHAPEHVAGPYLAARIEGGNRELALQLGPFRPGEAQLLIADSALAGLGPLIETLTDSRSVESDSDAERLVLRLTDPRLTPA